MKRYLAVSALILAVLGGLCAYAVTRPDRRLVFVREVPTALSTDVLDLSIKSLANWPKWFHSLVQAEREDLAGRALPASDQVVVKGALVRLTIQPKKGRKRGSFELLFTVTEYVPGQVLELVLTEDRAGKIRDLFDLLIWRIELSGSPITIRGTEIALTRNWRARLFGALSERILLNQVFYPDLMALGEFTQPQPLNPYPAYGQ